MSWVQLHPYNIAQKVEIVVEHYRDNVAPLLDGKAKAMVVLASRRKPCAGSSRSTSTSARRAIRIRNARSLLGRGR